jgi:hypothetical protein
MADSPASANVSSDSRRLAMSLPSWIFGSTLLAFILCVFGFAPASLPEFKQRILALACSLCAGLFAFFMTGDLGVKVSVAQSKVGKIAVNATGGLAAFVLVLWWWVSPLAPVTASKSVVDAINKASKQSTVAITTHDDLNREALTTVVKQDGQQTRDTVEDSALSTLETMFPLAVRIPRDVDGTIIPISGQNSTRILSYDKNMQPMKLYWGDQFHYFVFTEGGKGSISAGATVYLQLGSRSNAIRLPIILDPSTEKTLIIPGHSPEPLDAFLINPTGISGVSLKVTVYSADRERGRAEFRHSLLETPLGSYARKSYMTTNEDGVRLRSSPISDASSRVLRSMVVDTYVKRLKVEGEWAQVRLPEGREGWIQSRLLSPIQ